MGKKLPFIAAVASATWVLPASAEDGGNAVASNPKSLLLSSTSVSDPTANVNVAIMSGTMTIGAFVMVPIGATIEVESVVM